MLTLIKWRIRITIARYRRQKLALVGVILGLIVFIAALFSSQGLFSVLNKIAPSFADALLLGAYAAVGVFQILAGFRWGVTRLFLNSDLEMLMCAPLPRRRLFGLKVLELVVASPLSIALLFTVTWGYTRSRNVVGGPVLALVLPFVLATIATLPGMLVALLLARAMIGPRLRTLIGLVSPLMPLAWVLAFGSASSFVGRVTARRVDEARLQRLGHSIVAAIERSPTSWPGDVVRGIATADWVVVGRSIALTVLVAAVLLAVTFSVFFATFESSWTRLAEASTKKRRGTLLERIAPPIAAPSRAIVIKEWRGFARDLRQLQSLVFPLLFFGFFMLNSFRRTGTPPYALLFVLAFTLPNQAAAALLMEKRNIGFLKLTPVRGMEIIVGKVVAYAIPMSILIGAAAVAIGVVRHLSGPMIVLALVFVVWILSVAMLGGVGLAALWGRFDTERANLGLLPALAEMVIVSAFTAAQALLAFWLAGRLGQSTGVITRPILGIPIVMLAAGTTALIAVIAVQGARRLETFDAP